MTEAAEADVEAAERCGGGTRGEAFAACERGGAGKKRRGGEHGPRVGDSARAGRYSLAIAIRPAVGGGAGDDWAGW